MNDNARAWVAALRSGDYDQTSRYLHTDSGYCCLGVACEVYREKTGDGAWNSDPASQGKGRRVHTFEVGGEIAESVLPMIVIDWLGLYSSEGALGNRHVFFEGTDNRAVLYTLTGLNDTAEMTFEQIADAIEAFETDLFVDNPINE